MLSIPTMTFVETHLKAWDKDYASRGRLWGSGAKNLPALRVGSSVLELGCGDGKTLAGMPAGLKIIALDISPQALHLARKVRTDVDLILADASRLPLQSENFDAVFAFHVTGHLLAKGRCALAQEAERVLLPSGRLFFREFAAEDMRAGQGEEVEPETFRRKNGILTHYFTESEVEDLFSRLKPASIGTHRWNLRIKGETHVRAEVEAVFLKS